MNITISIPRLHPGQQQIRDNLKRFNVVNCGRRFGKTQYGFERLITPALEGYPAAWFAPSYRMMKEVWDKTILTLHEIIEHKDAQSKALTLKTGGKLEFWSLDSPNFVRGRKYKHIVIDEAAYVKDMKNTWQRILRPLLADYRGTADFFSTPNGKQNFFYELAQRHEDDPQNWSYFKMPTSSNPFIHPEEIEAARRELDRLTFEQEYLANFVDFVGMPFAYAFDPSKHVKPCGIDPQTPLFLSFDFGVEPMPCVAAQVNHFTKKIRVVKEFAMPNGDLRSLLINIKAWLQSLPQKPVLRITGDPSGTARNALSDGAANAYLIIKEALNIRKDYITVPRKFSISNSRRVVNSVIEHFDFAISPDCPLTIADFKFVEIETGAFGEVKLKKTGKNEAAGVSNEVLTHLLDAVRYLLHLEFYNLSAKL